MDRRALEAGSTASNGAARPGRGVSYAKSPADRIGRQPRLTTLVACLVGVAALYLAKEVLIPFALAALVSFLLAPLVARLERWRLPRVVAVLSALLLALGGTGIVMWIVAGEAQQLAAKIPEYRQNIRHKTAVLREILAEPFEQGQIAVKTLSTDLAGDAEAKPAPARARVEPAPVPVRTPLQAVGDTLSPILRWLTMAAMVLFFAVVMLLRADDVRDRLIRLVGSGQIYTTTQALEEASGKVSAYLARQLFINGLLGASAGLCLLLIGVPNALLWGLMFTILRFIPYIGAWIACGIPILLSFAIFDGWVQPLETAGAYIALELLGAFILEPWIYGAGTGVSPLAILASALFWSWLWGPIGLVLATPLTVCLVVMGKYVPRLHFLYLLCSDAPALPPATRLYQRLVAQDQDGAWSVLKSEVGQKSWSEIHDSIVLPALCMAEHDRQRGTLEDEAAMQLHENVQLLLDESDETIVRTIEAGDGALASRVPPIRVLCLPARSAADVTSAAILARAIEREGASVSVTPRSELLGETVKNLDVHPVDVVFVSAVPPSRFLYVRYICKRLTEHFPGLQIVVCMWTWKSQAPELEERVPAGGHIAMVTTLEEALAKLRQIAGQPRSSLAGTSA